MKQAIIIGVTSGIGEALARKLAGKGWRVAVTGRREKRLASLASEIGGVARKMDLADPDAARLVLEQGHGHLAGISSIARFRGSSEGAAYAASNAFVSVYLDGLRDLARKRNVTVTVTELCPALWTHP